MTMFDFKQKNKQKKLHFNLEKATRILEINK